MKFPVQIVGFSVLLLSVVAISSVRPFSVEAAAENAPTVVSVVTSNTSNGTTDNYPGGSISPTAGGTKTIYVNGLVEDLDGQATIASVRGVFRRSGATNGNTCANSGNDCYVVAACGLTNDANANRKAYSCQMNLKHYSDSTDASGRYPTENWVAYVEVADATHTGTDSALTKEMNSVLSLTIPGNIEFGNKNIGDVTTAANNVEMSIAQAGNVNADVEVSMASALTCTSGSMARDRFKWAVTDVGFSSGSSTVMTASPVDTNLDVGYGTDGSPSPSKFLYFNMSVPSGIGGTCSGITTLSAISH